MVITFVHTVCRSSPNQNKPAAKRKTNQNRGSAKVLLMSVKELLRRKKRYFKVIRSVFFQQIIFRYSETQAQKERFC